MDYDNGFILQKTVDWSLLNDGMTIPVSVCSLFTSHHIDYFTHSQNNDSTNIIIISPYYHWIIHKNNPTFNRKKFQFEFENGEVLFIDLRQWGEPFEKKYIQFSTEQIQQIAENFHKWQRVGYEETYHNEPEYCYSATLEEIEKKGWSLVPSKYIEFRNRDEQVDFDTKMKQLQAEMRDLLQQEEESKQELKALFEKLG